MIIIIISYLLAVFSEKKVNYVAGNGVSSVLHLAQLVNQVYLIVSQFLDVHQFVDYISRLLLLNLIGHVGDDLINRYTLLQ